MKKMPKRNTNKTSSRRPTPPLIPALLAVGGACTLGAQGAAALELGDIQVDSSLGQPLRASIAYALNPNEQLYDFCIFLRPGITANGMPNVSRARISVTDGAILISGATAVKEPLLALQLSVDCPYTPHLQREYMLMVDPARPATTAAQQAPAAKVPATAEPVAARQESQAPATPRRTVPGNNAPIEVRSRYRVQPGDTLSTIVARIEDRSLTMWPAVYAIFDANPHAFVDNDVNRLMAGSWLDIPDLGGASVVSLDAPTAPATAVTEAPQTSVRAYDGAGASSATESVTNTATAAVTSPASVPEPVPVAVTAPAETTAVPAASAAEAAVEAPAVRDAAAPELRPGDVIVGGASTVRTPIGEAEPVIDIPDTRIESAVPRAATPPAATSGAWDWLLWLGGSGVALILGLLFFGRSLRERFGSTPVGAAIRPPRRRTDDPSRPVPVLDEIDYEFEDTVNSRAISLDADLDDGTGLKGDADLDVAEDFGYAATGSGENAAFMEFPAEAAESKAEPSTDIIPPNHRTEESSILEEEVPPSDDDSAQYDLSMIVDATREPIVENDVTAQDLQAVTAQMPMVDDVDEADYTLNNELDYSILEQDYEEEMTATQALNDEIAKAAIELAARMDADEERDATSEMPTIEEEVLVSEAPTVEQDGRGDSTVEMPPVSDPANTAELTASLPTEVEAENDALADGEITIEMDIGEDTIETKKTRAS